MNTWWIPKQKQYLSETKEWWCSWCQEVTPINRNPEWDGSFKGERPSPEWFVKCAYCGKKHYQGVGYDCPECGYEPEDREPMHCSKPKHNQWAAMEFGGSPMDWTEVYWCPHCRTFFHIENSNY